MLWFNLNTRDCYDSNRHILNEFVHIEYYYNVQYCGKRNENRYFEKTMLKHQAIVWYKTLDHREKTFNVKL